MTRRDEQKLQNVADQNPPAVETLKNQKKKLFLVKFRSEVKFLSVEYIFLSYASREIIAHVFENCITSIDYFRFYITKTHCDLIAKHINMQTVIEIITKTFAQKKARYKL